MKNFELIKSIETKQLPKQPLRMVTLLIQDIRSGTIDHQLVEVKIPIKPTDDPEDGFWADAKLLVCILILDYIRSITLFE